MPPPLVSSMMTILMTNDPGGDLVHLLVVAGGDLLHLLVVLPPSKAGQACLPLVLHMLMPKVTLHIWLERCFSGAGISIIIMSHLSPYLSDRCSLHARCIDPTELGSYMSSVACPACPQGGHLLPGHVQVEKERLDQNFHLK